MDLHIAKDHNSFDQLYKEYQLSFVQFANSYIKDIGAAEDITVDAFIYYWENRHSLEQESNLPAYILTVIKHKCLNYLRHQHIREEHAEDIREYYQWELDSRISTLEDCEPYALFTAEILEIVRNTLESLPEQTCKVFNMSRYENKKYSEIAEQLNMSTKGVEYHIGKALQALRTNLKDYFPLFLLFFKN